MTGGSQYEREDESSAEFEVYIAYHRSTPRARAVAERLAEKLSVRGVTPFLDTKDIEAGEPFIRPILSNIRRARLVIVLFTSKLSTWVHFEAACAFFDEKLLAVTIDGASVPMPYGRIQFETLPDITEGNKTDDAALERVADLAKQKLYGKGKHAANTRKYRRLNRMFFSGLPIVFVVLFPLFLFILIEIAGDFGAHQVNHLHATLGAAILGGQFFLALGFARSVASPSFREREYGFETTERLFGIWACFAVIQPMLGLYLANWADQPVGMECWVWLSLVLYIMGMLFSLAGYMVAKSARYLDREHKPPREISRRDFLANVLFLVGFLMTVSVLNVMIARNYFAC